jgi:hypothetical protein
MCRSRYCLGRSLESAVKVVGNVKISSLRMPLFLPLTLRSGKCSLLLTLLRLLVLDYGIILVGDIDPQTLPRKLIRSRMIAISQDPFILKSSLRQIIDPCLSVSDEPILEALAKVKSGLSLRIVQGWTKT